MGSTELSRVEDSQQSLRSARPQVVSAILKTGRLVALSAAKALEQEAMSCPKSLSLWAKSAYSKQFMSCTGKGRQNEATYAVADVERRRTEDIPPFKLTFGINQCQAPQGSRSRGP